MQVLVTEQQPGGSAEAAERLTAAGHALSHCHPRGDVGGELCAAQARDGRCPLSDNPVDVMVDVRTDAGPMSPREFGVACALRSGTPVVIAGPVLDGKRWPWREADVRCAPEEVVAACKQATSPVGPAAQRTVTEAASRVLRQAGVAQHPTTTLHSKRGAIDILITTERALSPALREAVRTAARVSLVAYTPTWQYSRVYFMP